MASRYLLVGGNGMLGRDLAQRLSGRDVSAPDRSQLDLGDPTAIRDAVNGFDVVINAGAFTQVDAAERDEIAAHRVNAVGAGALAEAAQAAGARLIHVSTDYVFSGDAHSPIPEGAPRHPINAYGRSKSEGEVLVNAATAGALYLVRTAWLYGASGSNFARTIAGKLAGGESVEVVDDQVGQPTWSADVAAHIVSLLDNDAPLGVYHATSSGQATWFEFARAIAAELDVDLELVQPTFSDDYRQAAPRPRYSVLGHDAWSRAGLAPIREWRSALHAARLAGVLGAR